MAITVFQKVHFEVKQPGNHLFNRSQAVYVLLLFYLLLAGGVVWGCGANMPVTMLTFVLAIVLTSILLTASHALFAAIISGIVVISLQQLTHNGLASNRLGWGDIFVCCALFLMIAFVLRFYIRDKERTLALAQQAEITLLEQKTALKSQTRKHMTELRLMQLEEMKQVYRSTELGQQGMTLLHDLAGHLTALKLEMEALEGERHSGAIIPTQKIVQHLEDMVESTCKRLHGVSQEQKFNLIKKMNETIAFLREKAKEAHVEIDWQTPARSWKYSGDVASLCQVVAILTKNAIDAYGCGNAQDIAARRVSVRIARTNTHYIIRIGDWGSGIPESKQKHIFEPFYSTKGTGLGLGLYIAKCITEIQFGGTIELNPHSNHTEFIVALPLVKPKK